MPRKQTAGMLDGDVSPDFPGRHGQAMTSTMFHEATLLSRRQLTPGMIRLTFGGPGLSTFKSTGIGDEYLRLFFPNEKTGRLHLPHIAEDGRWTYPDGQDALRYSTYTIRGFRPERGEIDIDFVVHAGGRASEWAQRAMPGARITINNPRGLYAPPADTVWQLLVADATGLPALSRLLEQTPRHVQSRVFVEVARSEDEQELPAHPGATMTWLHRSGNGVAPSRMGDVVRAVPLPPTPGYLWVRAPGAQAAPGAIRTCRLLDRQWGRLGRQVGRSRPGHQGADRCRLGFWPRSGRGAR
jgi:NADPH-dependent ferric siderophore reductase